MYSMMTRVNTALWYIGKLLREKSFITRKKIVSFSFMLYLYKMMDFN